MNNNKSATISVCMIVKNEEKVLARCLDSLKGLYEELIIVDTGSTDSTKAIAGKYTDKVYDFEWVDDFSKARNFAMSFATMDYIYMADADEVLDYENHRKFVWLKKCLSPEIEIVEMYYCNQLSNGTVYNFDRELRPKLYRRLRSFSFIEPVHETVRLDPLVFESDIEIIHMPEQVHAARDIKIFEKQISNGIVLSKRLTEMYALELLLNGGEKELSFAKEYFEKLIATTEDLRIIKICSIVLAKVAEENHDEIALLKYSAKDLADKGGSEMCTILGRFFERIGDYEESAVWYYNAHYETEAELCIKYQNEYPLEGLVRVYGAMGLEDVKKSYEEELKNII